MINLNKGNKQLKHIINKHFIMIGAVLRRSRVLANDETLFTEYYVAYSQSANLCMVQKYITLQSEWPQTMTCLMSLCTQASSRAAGSHVVYSSRKCCECGIKLPAFLTRINNHIMWKCYKPHLENDYEFVFSTLL